MSGKIRPGSECGHRMFVRVVAATALLAAAASPAPAQEEPYPSPIRFERVDFEPLLPQSSVYLIHQDRHGFLWFGTREGLGRWDGYEMRTWKVRPFEPDALRHGIVRRLVEDSAGSFWIVSLPADEEEESVVSRVVGPDHARVETYPFRRPIPFVAGDGVAWIAERDSIYRHHPGTDRVAAMMPRARPGVDVHAAMMDRAGMIWVGTVDGILERYDPTTGSSGLVRPVASTPGRKAIYQIVEDAAGTLWLTGAGVRRLDSGRSRIEPVTGRLAALDGIGTADLVQDPDGWFWLASNDGVYRFDPDLNEVERYSLRLPGDIETQNYVVGLACDRSGRIWAGTVWGLHRYDPWADVFGFLAHDPADPATLGSGLVLSVLEDRTGALWAGTLGGGLNRIDRRTGRVRRFRHRAGDDRSLNHDWVWSLADAGGGRVWVGTGDGLALVDPATERPVRRIPIDLPAGIQTGSVFSLRRDGADLWIGTAMGAYRRHGDGRIERAVPIAARVQSMIASRDTLWLATTAGLIRQVVGTANRQEYRHDPRDSSSLSNDLVLSLHRDRAGRLWVGTSSGLNRLDPGASGFRHYGAESGLPSTAVYAILEAADSALWIGTNRGLARVDPDAPPGTAVRAFEGPALGNVEFNRNAAAVGRDGTMFLGGDRGLTWFHPRALRDNPHPPAVVLTSLQRSTREGSRIDRWLPDSVPVVLAPDDYTVTFTFAALNFTNPARNRYSYRLEGFDDRWVDAGTTRTASYTNLPAGRYLFRVRGANDDGRWNAAGLSVPVVVEPWLWETWWFRGGAAIALATLISFVTGMVLRARHRRQLDAVRYQRALESERARISRDMHDEVGASLTEIVILSEQALRRNGSAPETPIERIASRSRTMLAALGEIIWAINPDNDRLAHLAAYLREYAGEFLDSVGLDAALDFDSDGITAVVSAEFRRNVFLVLKESLANVAKHAGARRVEVRLSAAEDRLRLTIADDGRGMAPDPNRTDGAGHDGIANMARRAAELGGSVRISRGREGGTIVELEVPLPGGREAS